MSHPLTKRLGLETTFTQYGRMVKADDLEKILENAVVVYGCIPPAEERDFWGGKRLQFTTHIHLLTNAISSQHFCK